MGYLSLTNVCIYLIEPVLLCIIASGDHTSSCSFIVEDPVNDFLRLRDYVDVLRCRSLPVFKPNYLCKGFSKEMVDQARRKLKVNQVEKMFNYHI